VTGCVFVYFVSEDRPRCEVILKEIHITLFKLRKLTVKLTKGCDHCRREDIQSKRGRKCFSWHRRI